MLVLGDRSILERDYIVAVVGGGAGIGAAAAEHIGRLGASVFVIDTVSATAAATAKRVASTGARAGCAAADVHDLASVQQAVGKATEWNGRIHAVINAASLRESPGGRVDGPAIVNPEHTARINLTGAVVIAHAVVPWMYKAGYGRIAHLTPADGKDMGLISLVKSQGRELATTGITVNALVPDGIDPPAFDIGVPGFRDSTPECSTAQLDRLTQITAMLTLMISPACRLTAGTTLDLSDRPATY